jgi:hypothetical protein
MTRRAVIKFFMYFIPSHCEVCASVYIGVKLFLINLNAKVIPRVLISRSMIGLITMYFCYSLTLPTDEFLLLNILLLTLFIIIYLEKELYFNSTKKNIVSLYKKQKTVFCTFLILSIILSMFIIKVFTMLIITLNNAYLITLLPILNTGLLSIIIGLDIISPESLVLINGGGSSSTGGESSGGAEQPSGEGPGPQGKRPRPV